MGTEQDIFDSAIEAEEGASPTQVSETNDKASAEEQAAQQPPAGPQPPAAESAAPQPDQPPPQPHLVPLKELLDTRERAQAAEREREDLRKRIEAFERQQREAQAKPATPPDQFADPEGYTNFILAQGQRTVQNVMQQIRMETLNDSLEDAGERHGKLFEEAFQALVATNDPMLVNKLTARPRKAGDSIVNWYREQQVIREVGNDPAAYRQKLQDDLLKDPAFLARAIEQARGQGGAQNNGSRPQTVTRLPSLNRQPSAASAHDADDGDDSEEAVFAAGRR